MPTPIIDALKDDSDLTMHTHTEADLGATLDNRYVNVTGDTMTGNLILNDNVSVLLGTGSDGELFHDGSNTYFQNNTGNIIIENDASDGDITFKVNDGGVDKTVMTLDGATGNVGIGTTSPISAMHIYESSAGVNKFMTFSNPTVTGIFGLVGAGSSIGFGSTTNNDVIFYSNNSERFKIKGDGTTQFNDNVGIGTTAPAGRLHVESAFAQFLLKSTAATQSNIEIITPSGSSYIGQAGGAGELVSFSQAGDLVINNRASSKDILITADSSYTNPQLVLKEAGNVGIGTTSPSGRLHINGTADDQQLIVEAHSTQTNNIVEIHDSSSNVLISFNGVGGAVFNEQGSATADFRVESDTEANMLFVDANANTDGSVYLGGTTNGIEIKKGGDLTLLGTAKYERHVQIPAMANGLPANQPAEVDFFTAGGLQFASAGAQYAYCQWEIPDDWDGTDVVFEVDWFPDSGAISGTDTIKWDVEYRSIAEGEAINNGTSVTVSVTDSTDYAQYITKHSRFTLTYNNANQPLVNQDHIYFKISRDTSVANDFAGTVTVAAYEIIYQSKGFPSSN